MIHKYDLYSAGYKEFFSIIINDNLKIGDFEKGYTYYKKFLRYKKILIDFATKIQSILNYNDLSTRDFISLKSLSINTPKSNRSYKSYFKNEKSIEYPYYFDDLSREPSSVIKSSPKYSTYFAEN